MSLEMDIPSLLSPFDGEFRGGMDLRDDDDPNNAYRRIRDARNEARDEERQADINGVSSASALRLWREVWDNGQEYLRSVAKDLEIVAYMIEASIRLNGFAGLSQSLTLTRELLESFWGELLPTPDEDGIETTLRPLSRLNGDVITYALSRIAVTEDTSGGMMVVWQYAQARLLETLNPEERATRVASGAVTMEQFSRAVAETSAEFFIGLAGDLRDARLSIQQLQSVLEERVDDAEVPNLSRFIKSVDEADGILRQVAGNYLTAVQAAEEGGDATEAAEIARTGATNASAGGSGGTVVTRDDALNLLETAAKWFERHEPQSILPAAIRKAIRRARMSPMELYQDLIADSDARRQLFRDVGIDVPESDQ